jgi:hypothetical protein
MGRRKQAEEKVNDMESRKTRCAYQIEYLTDPRHLCRQGKIRPVIFKTDPLEEVSVALEVLASRKTSCKLIVSP